MTTSKTDALRPLARHGRKAAPGLMRQFLRALGVAVSVMVVSSVGVVAYAAVDLTTAFTSDAVDINAGGDAPPDIGELSNVGVDILVTGLDACENAFKQMFPGRCDPDIDYDQQGWMGVLNDVNMIIHISPEPRRVTVLSIPRDLMVEIPDCTNEDGETVYGSSYASFNEAYGRGGLACVVDTARELTGLNIQYAASVKWGGVIQISDAIGGVDVCLATPVKDLQNTGLDLPAGTHTLVGITALEFLRTRHGVGDGSDLGRISNQQVFMTSLVRKLTSENVLGNVSTMLTLGRTVLENVDPSTSLTNPVTLAQIGVAIKDVPLDQFVFVQYPSIDDPYNPGVKVAPDEFNAAPLLEAISQNIPIQLSGNTGVGAVVEGDDGTSTPTPEPTDTPLPTDSLGPTPAPSTSPSVIDLGQNVSGTNAATTTCSSRQ